MSEEVGKALQSVAERVNQAAARRPKVAASWGLPGPPGRVAARRRRVHNMHGHPGYHRAACAWVSAAARAQCSRVCVWAARVSVVLMET